MVAGNEQLQALIARSNGIPPLIELASTGDRDLAAWLGFFAIVLATINVVGGFLVTHRMLGMFRRKD